MKGREAETGDKPSGHSWIAGGRIQLTDGRAYAVALGLFLVTVVALTLGPGRVRPLGTGLIAAVTAAVYVGFGLVDGRPRAISIEVGFAAAVVVVAGIGAFAMPPLLAVALLAHAGWDLLHHRSVDLIRTNTVPTWYPSFCMVYDVLAAGAVLLLVRA
ncbi:MAG: hypothetical protein M3O87_02490 [Candidatus Dormibacteraeota bacterium]|nr:hypothetical protein [Candidatus Dormibacteraeota bacterium]